MSLGGWYWVGASKEDLTDPKSTQASLEGALLDASGKGDRPSTPNRQEDLSAEMGYLSDWLSPLTHFPEPDTIHYLGKAYRVPYATDSLLQARVDLYMRRFHPEKAAFLISDLETGQLLAASESETTFVSSRLHFSLRATYPAASIIKIVTAAAGLTHCMNGPEDSLPQLGSNHTLYRSQLRVERCTTCPQIELRQAFARSINPAFGVLGLRIGQKNLQKTAENFGFNSDDIPMRWETSQYTAPDSGYPLAEVACGFTDKSTLSPLHALQIARAIGDDGRLVTPVLAPYLESLEDNGKLAAPYSGLSAKSVANRETLAHLKVLMEATTSIGTARKGFHRAMRQEELQHLITGGKTGSLDGNNPKGRYEWFIGYVRMKDNPSKGLAIAVMTINEKYLAIHPAELAAHVVKDWLRHYRKLQRKNRTDSA